VVGEWGEGVEQERLTYEWMRWRGRVLVGGGRGGDGYDIGEAGSTVRAGALGTLGVWEKVMACRAAIAADGPRLRPRARQQRGDGPPPRWRRPTAPLSPGVPPGAPCGVLAVHALTAAIASNHSRLR